METKLHKPGAAVGLELADKQIALLKSKRLPEYPHQLSVPTKYPYRPEFPFENQNTPFRQSEVKYLQYMTLLSNGDRGVGVARGDWEDDITGANMETSPGSGGAGSNTTTPNPFKDSKKPAVKMSIADYKNLKQSGIKPSPRPQVGTPTPDPSRGPGHSRNTSAVSAVGTPMSRGPSFEGAPAVKQNGAPSVSANLVRPEKVQSKVTERPRDLNPSEAREKSRATTNGHVEHATRESSQHTNKDPRSQNPALKQPPPVKHGLPPKPPRPQSPSRRNPDPKRYEQESKPQKRQLDSNDGYQPEKRTNIEHSRTHSGSSYPLPRKPDTSSTKPSPVKPIHNSQPSTSHASPQSRKAALTSNPTEIKKENKPTPEKPRNIPPLLSPLPPDLDNSPPPTSQPAPSSVANIKKTESGRNSSSNTPSKPKVAADTIVVKSRQPAESSPLSTPPKSSEKQPRAHTPLPIPPLLSPDLPEVVEQALLNIQQKAHISVEARHEKARLPDAPGVARKTVKPKTGHPPKQKKSIAQASKPQDVEDAEPSKPSLLIKLKYKKRREKDIERILNIRPRPSKPFLALEAQRLGRLQPSALPKDDSSSDDGPLSKVASKTTTPPTKKRPSDSSTSDRAPEPAAKRKKLPEDLDVAMSRTPVAQAFKSPAPSNPSQKNLLSTPKKGDAMKSVAMRRVDSSDGHAHTPQPANTSTPASAEKPRINGEVRSMPNTAEIEKLGAESKRLTELALKLKRKMDNILKAKQPPSERESVPEKEKKLGLSVGLECVVVYMNAFFVGDKIDHLKHRVRNPKQWEQLANFWRGVNYNFKTEKFPVFEALSLLLGALMHEELVKAHVDGLAQNSQNQTYLKALAGVSKLRDDLWAQKHKMKEDLVPFGGNETLGPWTSVQESTTYAIGVLTAYSRKEQTGWKRDPGF